MSLPDPKDAATIQRITAALLAADRALLPPALRMIPFSRGAGDDAAVPPHERAFWAVAKAAVERHRAKIARDRAALARRRAKGSKAKRKAQRIARRRNR